ncbi:MAG TPA: carbonic anhydrase family protein, partial [Rhodocyclaceae bacterium]|nr:carbonic anhydrase family protein [Rhodocyclaceae bacterium]
KAAEKPANPRPRFFEIPIDKSKLEDPGGAAAKAGEAKADAGVKPDGKAGKPADKPAAKAPESVADAASRHALERQYATSGPRRGAASRRTAGAPAVAPSGEREPAHWSYEGEGAPANWGKLRSDYATCASGKRQSPIDIRDGIRVDLEPATFDYHPSLVRITDNGHTVQVAVGEGSSMTLTGKTYRLVQFHFHRPAEERVNGKLYDMVIHLVHQDDEGRLAVVAVLLEKGAENPVIQALWNNMPLEVDQPVEPPGLRVNPLDLLPAQQAYYTYMGSLTTPPCTEGVLWLVMKQPMPVSAEQIAIFSRLYKNNARPIQSANNRLIKESR